MGPIIDEIGLEQGGKNSTELWKVYNNEQLNVPQQTDFGVDIADVHVASIGRADDCVLLSTDLHKLKFLLHLRVKSINPVDTVISRVSNFILRPSNYEPRKSCNY